MFSPFFVVIYMLDGPLVGRRCVLDSTSFGVFVIPSVCDRFHQEVNFESQDTDALKKRASFHGDVFVLSY